MKHHVGLGLLLGLVSFAGISRADHVFCENPNNNSFEITETADTVTLESMELGGHTIAKVLKLPMAGQPYRYTMATLVFDKANCRTHSQDKALRMCSAGKIQLNLASPQATVELDSAWFSLERHQQESVQAGKIRFQRNRLVMRTKDGHVVTEDADFAIPSCSIK